MSIERFPKSQFVAKFNSPLEYIQIVTKVSTTAFYPRLLSLQQLGQQYLLVRELEGETSTTYMINRNIFTKVTVEISYPECPVVSEVAFLCLPQFVSL